MRGIGDYVRAEFLGSDHHLLLPAQWAHVTFGTRAGENTQDLQQGKIARLLVTLLVNKPYIRIHVHKHACVYVYMKTKLCTDMHSFCLVFKTKR